MIFACVRTGKKYGFNYVENLYRGIRRNTTKSFQFMCITDDTVKDYGLDGWWTKMALFEPSWRIGQTVIYMDLDVVCVGDLDPLTEIESDFAICENFARLSGRYTWPCLYNSSVMVIGPYLNGEIWKGFMKNKERIMFNCRRYGDQKAVEMLKPGAPFLQHLLPPDFFLGYREMYSQHKDKKPDGCSIVVFAGAHKPDNDDVPAWVKEEWNVDVRQHS